MGAKRKLSAKGKANADQSPQKKPKVEAEASHAISKADKQKLFLDKSPFKESLAREDHERERQLYKLLGSEDMEDRIKAADVIVSVLLDNEGVPGSVFKRHLEGRLFRGLASGNNAARIGFGYVLAELLGQLFGEKDLAAARYPELTFDKVLGMLIEKTQGAEGMREGRDTLWGQLFGLQTFTQAGVLFRDATRWRAVLELLLDLGNKKLWMRSQSAFVIAQALPKLDRREVKKTLKKVSGAGIAKTLEGLGIWLAAAEHFPDMDLPSPWEHPLSSKSLPDVIAALKSTDKEAAKEEDAAGGQQQRNATSQLHFAWDLIFRWFLKPHPSRETADFALFWDRVVDQVYFTKAASDHQKLLGFKLFRKAIKDGASEGLVMPGVFSKNSMAVMVNQASKPGPRLHRAALLCFDGVEKVVKNNSALLVPALRGLLDVHGFFNLDERLRNASDPIAPVKTLIRSTNAGNVEDVVSTLRAAALADSKGDDDQKTLRTLGEYLLRLTTRPSTDVAEEEPGAGTSVVVCALQELARLAYPRTDGVYPFPTPSVQETCRKHVSSGAVALLKHPAGFSSLQDFILDIDPKGIDMSDDIRSQVLEAMKRLRRLSGGQGDARGRQVHQGLTVLHAIAILQLYNDPGPDSLEVLQDTEKCVDLLDSLEDGAESSMSEVLIEVLLSMLAGPSSVSKQASLRIFEMFTPFMTESALKGLTEVLVADESAEGHDALFSNADEELADGDEDEDEDIDMEDIDDVPSDVVDEDDDASDEESGASDSEAGSTHHLNGVAAEDSEKLNGEEDFESALMKAFNISHTLDRDHDAESSSDADMSDTEMLALDEKLAAHMKLLRKKPTKKQRDEAKRKVIAFKSRVLDLLSIFVGREAASINPLVFGLFPPLLKLIRTTKDKSISNKATQIVTLARKVVKKEKKKSVCAQGAVDADSLLAALKEVHKGADDPTENKAFAAAFSAASLSIAGVLFEVANYGGLKRMDRLYSKTWKRCLTGKISVRKEVFADWIEWCMSQRPHVKLAE